jgi:uncharacterized protein YebE (UPF0316 family)
MKFLIVFIILSIINVTFSTVRSITTIKSGKLIASLISGGYFAFYNIMLIYTVADFPMWQKCVITFACNVVGVFIVKWIEEKLRKDKLWRVEVTVPASQGDSLAETAKEKGLSFNYIDIQKYWIFNFYCPTQKESAEVKEMLKDYEAKYFVSETKIL